MTPRTDYWTQEEIETLKNLYPRSPLETIQAALPRRNLPAIRKKAMRLNLKREVDGIYKAVKPLNLTEIERAYIAGIIDGEGCVYIYRAKDGIQSSITVGNTSRELIDWLSQKVPGGNFKINSRGNHRTLYNYVIYSNHVLIALLEAVMPYLIVKKRHTRLLHRFLQLQRTRRRIPIYDYERHRFKGTRVIRNPEEDKLYEELRQLNLRGRLN